MMPAIHLNFFAILIATVVNFLVGFLWYTPFFGKIWAKELGLKITKKTKISALIRGMIFTIVGSFFMAYVFSHNIAVWNPVTWGLAPNGMDKTTSALMAAIFTWLGFYFPVDLGVVAWEQKSWKLFFINTGYHFVSLLVMAFILIFMA